MIMRHSQAYSIAFHWKHVNFLLVGVAGAGLLLYYMAPTLCRNTFFHYTTGITVGLLASILLVTYLLQRRFKQSLFSWVGLAYSLSVYLITRYSPPLGTAFGKCDVAI